MVGHSRRLDMEMGEQGKLKFRKEQGDADETQRATSPDVETLQGPPSQHAPNYPSPKELRVIRTSHGRLWRCRMPANFEALKRQSGAV